jgi:hypothetical protein
MKSQNFQVRVAGIRRKPRCRVPCRSLAAPARVGATVAEAADGGDRAARMGVETRPPLLRPLRLTTTAAQPLLRGPLSASPQTKAPMLSRFVRFICFKRSFVVLLHTLQCTRCGFLLAAPLSCAISTSAPLILATLRAHSAVAHRPGSLTICL